MMTETKHIPPKALAHFAEIQQALAGKKIAFFIDYDGTLTPIVKRPEQALLAQTMRSLLQALSEHHFLAIISGRELADVRRQVDLESVIYSGNHGLEIAGSDFYLTHPIVTPEYIDLIQQLYHALWQQLMTIKGVIIEDKKLSLSVHYRLVEPRYVSHIENVVNALVTQHPTLAKHLGKKVFEIRPKTNWNKGSAVLDLLNRFNLLADNHIPIYLGDDITDETAFMAVHTIGLGFLVAKDPHPTTANYYLRDPDEVMCFLQRLGDLNA